MLVSPGHFNVESKLQVDFIEKKLFQCRFSTGIRLMGNLHIHSMLFSEGVSSGNTLRLMIYHLIIQNLLYRGDWIGIVLQEKSLSGRCVLQSDDKVTNIWDFHGRGM